LIIDPISPVALKKQKIKRSNSERNCPIFTLGLRIQRIQIVLILDTRGYYLGSQILGTL
jgi:hypothetical protein